VADDDVQAFLEDVAARLDHGGLEYRDQSFVRPVSSTVDALLAEQLDQVGWCYVLWCQAARKADVTRDQRDLRFLFLQNLEHRIRRNDRRTPHDAGPAPRSCMAEIEVLALDLFEQRAQLRRRLLPIARAIEVAQLVHTDPFRARRGSSRDPRSDD
jgi:hypothetical protein